MDASTWLDCYDKLTKAFGKPKDLEQSRVYFEGLESIPGPTIRLAIHTLIREQKHWPNVAIIRDYCVQATKAVAAPPNMCDRCHGEGWVDAPPYEANGGVVYTNVAQRCPQCSVVRAEVA